MIVLFPLTFLSNAFVPVETMPTWLQWFVNINPVSHLVTAVRDLVSSSVFGADAWLSLLGTAVIVAIFAPLTVRASCARPDAGRCVAFAERRRPASSCPEGAAPRSRG